MRGHDHDLDGLGPLRPPAARLDEHDHTRAAEALAGGRPDALTPAGVTHLQRSAGNAAVAQRLAGEHEHEREEEPSPVHDVVGRGGGRPLDADTRADMEARLGADFGDVRIHDDARAHESAVAVNAHAYTVGHDVVFQRDRYDPASDAGRLTLAHELTHVVQQRSGPVDGAPAAGGVRISDPSDRFERDAAANAERVLAAPAPVQREAGPEEEDEVQTLRADTPLQREAGPEEDEEPA